MVFKCQDSFWINRFLCRNLRGFRLKSDFSNLIFRGGTHFFDVFEPEKYQGFKGRSIFFFINYTEVIFNFKLILNA